MNNIIDELKTLIVNPKKGTTGHTCLKNSERVTAHKLNALINNLTNAPLRTTAGYDLSGLCLGSSGALNNAARKGRLTTGSEQSELTGGNDE